MATVTKIPLPPGTMTSNGIVQGPNTKLYYADMTSESPTNEIIMADQRVRDSYPQQSKWNRINKFRAMTTRNPEIDGMLTRINHNSKMQLYNAMGIPQNKHRTYTRTLDEVKIMKALKELRKNKCMRLLAEENKECTLESLGHYINPFNYVDVVDKEDANAKYKTIKIKQEATNELAPYIEAPQTKAELNEQVMEMLRPLAASDNSKKELDIKVKEFVAEYEGNKKELETCAMKSSVQRSTAALVVIGFLLFVIIFSIYMFIKIQKDPLNNQFNGVYGPDFDKKDHLDKVKADYKEKAKAELLSEGFSETGKKVLTQEELKQVAEEIEKMNVYKMKTKKDRLDAIDNTVENMKFVPVPDRDIVNRTMARGTLASIVSATFVAIGNGIFDGFGNVNSSTSAALIGMVVGAMIGFIADIYYGSDEGRKAAASQGSNKKLRRAYAMKYAFANIATSKFARYLVTVLLDTYVSTIFLDPVLKVLKMNCFLAKYTPIALGIASGFIGVATFQAYTNQTRFLWAYPSSTIKTRELLLKSGTVMIATVVAGIIFLVTPTGMGLDKREGINSRGGKVFLFIFTLMLLTSLSMFEVTDAELPYKREVKIVAVNKDTNKELSDVEKIEYESDEEKLKLISYREKMVVTKTESKSIDEMTKGWGTGFGIFISLTIAATLGTLLTKSTERFKQSDGSLGKPGERPQDMLKKVLLGLIFVAVIAFMFLGWMVPKTNNNAVQKMDKQMMSME